MARLTIRLTDEDSARLEAVAALQGMTRADVGRLALRGYVREVLAAALPPAEPRPVVSDERRKPVEGTDYEVPAEEHRPGELPRTGNELRAWREARGWTQEKLAEALGVSRRTVQSAEKRCNDQLTSTVLGRLAELG